MPYSTWYQTGYLLTICENIMAARALEAVNPSKKPFLLFSPDVVGKVFDLCTCSRCVRLCVCVFMCCTHSYRQTIDEGEGVDADTQHTLVPIRTLSLTTSPLPLPSACSSFRNGICDWLERGCRKAGASDASKDLSMDAQIGDMRDSDGTAGSDDPRQIGAAAALVAKEADESYSEWLAIEEKLFRHLVDVYRQPSELYRLTGRYEHWWDERDVEDEGRAR